MKKNVFFILLSLVLIVPGYTQQKDTEKKSETDAEITSETRVYEEIVLEDFETSQYTDQNIKFLKTKYQEAGINMKDQYPAPFKNSKKYIGLKMFGKMGDVLKIIPAKDLIIDKYCKEIAVWVYGKRFSGELSIILKDSSDKIHRLILGKLDFLGWRKLRVKLTKEVSQEDQLLNKKQTMKLMELQYRPANTSRMPIWHYLYIDDITATVREKYTDRQSDDW